MLKGETWAFAGLFLAFALCIALLAVGGDGGEDPTYTCEGDCGAVEEVAVTTEGGFGAHQTHVDVSFDGTFTGSLIVEFRESDGSLISAKEVEVDDRQVVSVEFLDSIDETPHLKLSAGSNGGEQA